MAAEYRAWKIISCRKTSKYGVAGDEISSVGLLRRALSAENEARQRGSLAAPYGRSDQRTADGDMAIQHINLARDDRNLKDGAARRLQPAGLWRRARESQHRLKYWQSISALTKARKYL